MPLHKRVTYALLYAAKVSTWVTAVAVKVRLYSVHDAMAALAELSSVVLPKVTTMEHALVAELDR